MSIPTSAEFKSNYVHLKGNALSVALPTNPTSLPTVTYVIRFRVASRPNTLGWIMSQAPDYGWSRAIAITDDRLGYVGQTPGTFDSTLGQISVGSWSILVGTYTQSGNCQTWLNGKSGKARSCSNGSGSNSNEVLIIGGRDITDGTHNPETIDISHAFVYDRAMNQADVDEIETILSGKCRVS